MEDGEHKACDGDHPTVKVSTLTVRNMSGTGTYIPSNSRNSFSFLIKGLPQPPAISGIR